MPGVVLDCIVRNVLLLYFSHCYVIPQELTRPISSDGCHLYMYNIII